MKKIDNFSASLNALKEADFGQANESIIYRTGIVGHSISPLSWLGKRFRRC